MRIRSLSVLSALALSGLLLAGCSGSATPTASGSASAGDLCSAAAAPGEASNSVTVDGTEGSVSTATFTPGLEVSGVQRTVVSEGTGDALKEGDWVKLGFSAFDATTGEKLGDAGYNDTDYLPQQLTAGSGFSQLIGCAPVGSRLVVTLPASESGGAQVYVLDVLGTTPTAAWGAQQDPVAGMPTVTLGADGTPTVAIPDAAAPTDIQISVLKKGDGPAVASGDTTLLQYYGVNWADGQSFDSSWSRGGTPISSQGNAYVPGFVQALDGQTVGSQVLVVIPPALGYGDQAQGSIPANSTLVFVIDILATQHAKTQ